MTEGYKVCDWYELHMKIAVRVLYGNQYKLIKEQTSRRRQKILSPSPSVWVNKFSRAIRFSLGKNIGWRPVFDCVNYFISTLSYAENREDVILDEIYDLIDEGLKRNSFTGRAKLFAEEMNAKKPEVLEAWEIGEQKIAARSE